MLNKEEKRIIESRSGSAESQGPKEDKDKKKSL